MGRVERDLGKQCSAVELITAWHAYHPEGVRARVVTGAQMQRAAYGENFPAGAVTFNRGMQPLNATLQGENQGNKGPSLLPVLPIGQTKAEAKS